MTQTYGTLSIDIAQPLAALGDFGISTAIYKVISKRYEDCFRQICRDSRGPKCSAEMYLGEEDGQVNINYTANVEMGVVDVEWYSDDMVGAQTVEKHVRSVVEEAHYEDFHPVTANTE